MSKYDLVFTLITIVYGLMLTELFASIHKLIRHKKVIKWHWLPLLVVWYLFLVIIKNWWGLALPGDNSPEINIFVFLGYSHLLLLLFLLVSAVLPDFIPTEGLILKEYYFENVKYFWGLMIAVNLGALLISFISSVSLDTQFSLLNLVANLFGILLMLVLFFSRKLWLHELIVIFFVLVVCFEIIVS